MSLSKSESAQVALRLPEGLPVSRTTPARCLVLGLGGCGRSVPLRAALACLVLPEVAASEGW